MNTEHTPESLEWLLQGDKVEPVSYGEPWKINPGFLSEVYADNTEYIGTFGMNEDAARAVACVNALAGVADPEEALREAREILETLSRYVVACGYPDGPCIDYQDMIDIKSALAKLSPEKV